MECLGSLGASRRHNPIGLAATPLLLLVCSDIAQWGHGLTSLAAATQAFTITVAAQDTALDTGEVTTPGAEEGHIRDEDIRRHLAATIHQVLVLPT